MNDQLFVLNSQKKKTNHVLHLLLCIPTGGFWAIPWLIIASNNRTHNREIAAEINILMSYRLQGLSDVQAFRRMKKGARGRWIRDDCLFIVAAIAFTIALVYLLKR
ncbi:MAG: hypothetical protein ACOH2P_12525 [Pseudomonas sp.]